MLAGSHVLFGVTAYTGLAMVSPALPLDSWTIAAATLGSLAPDLDHPKSWLGSRLFFISIPLSTIFGHRGATHSLVAALASATYLAWHLYSGGVAWPVAFLVGYLTHLWGDWNCNSGVPLFWPSPRKYKAPWSFPTGGLVERLISVGFGSFLVYLGWEQFVTRGVSGLFP